MQNEEKLNKLQLRAMSIEELRELMISVDEPAFRAAQLFRWLHKQGVADFEEMKNISKLTRQKLALIGDIALPKVIIRQESGKKDTVKLLLEYTDGTRIESVLMMYKRGESRDRATVCVSTQSGCVMGCRFCVTGGVGAGRNLTAAEIVAQVLLMEKEAVAHGFAGVTNIVYMGMGEPALNLANVHKSLQLFNAEDGLNIGIRRMTVSTCGIVPAIYELADWGMQVGLAISLHAPNDGLRAELMPVAAKYKLKDVLAAADYYFDRTGQRVTYEYAMFRGINDAPAQAEELCALLRGRPAMINLIPANLGSEAGFLPSKVESIKEFANIMSSNGLEVAMRERRGVDIDAACGQLRRR